MTVQIGRRDALTLETEEGAMAMATDGRIQSWKVYVHARDGARVGRVGRY